MGHTERTDSPSLLLAVGRGPLPLSAQKSLTPASTENIALLTAFANTREVQRAP